MILNYNYRIYPDGNQIELLNQWLETCRLSYNYALRELKDGIAKLGKVQINLHRPIPFGFVIKQVRVVKKAVEWFAVVAIQSDIERNLSVPHSHAIGVDVGLLSYVATSDGYTEGRPKFFQTAYRRLKVLQKRLSRKMKRGKNYEKARIKVAKQHNRVENL